MTLNDLPAFNTVSSQLAMQFLKLCYVATCVYFQLARSYVFCFRLTPSGGEFVHMHVVLLCSHIIHANYIVFVICTVC
jgi:hypothetical protein